jgi:hypothetical protein
LTAVLSNLFGDQQSAEKVARNKTIKILRTTRANLNAQAAVSGLIEGEPYFITDEKRVAVASGVNEYSAFVKESEFESFCCTTSSYALSNTTSNQKIFNTSTNGALTVLADTTYFFEASVCVNTMSATSGNLSMTLNSGGTATFTSVAWHAFGLDSTAQTGAAIGGCYTQSAGNSGNIVTAATGTSVSVLVKGIFRVNTGGTIVPSLALTTATASALVQQNSWFKCYAVGAKTVTSKGAWS